MYEKEDFTDNKDQSDVEANNIEKYDDLSCVIKDSIWKIIWKLQVVLPNREEEISYLCGEQKISQGHAWGYSWARA